MVAHWVADYGARGPVWFQPEVGLMGWWKSSGEGKVLYSSLHFASSRSIRSLMGWSVPSAQPTQRSSWLVSHLTDRISSLKAPHEDQRASIGIKAHAFHVADSCLIGIMRFLKTYGCSNGDPSTLLRWFVQPPAQQGLRSTHILGLSLWTTCWELWESSPSSLALPGRP